MSEVVVVPPTKWSVNVIHKNLNWKDTIWRRRPDAGWKFEGRIRPRDLSTVFQRTRSLLPLGSELIGPGNSYWLLTNPPEGQQGSLVDVVVHLQSSPLQSILF